MRVDTRYTFERLELAFRKNVRCATCGKPVRRQKTIGQTQSPFNLNAAGEPASRVEIYEKIRAEGDAWQVKPEHCQGCEPVR